MLNSITVTNYKGDSLDISLFWLENIINKIFVLFIPISSL